jgi:hypothetical protein
MLLQFPKEEIDGKNLDENTRKKMICLPQGKEDVVDWCAVFRVIG